MTNRTKTDLKVVLQEHDSVEDVMVEAAKQAAPMVQRYAGHRDRISLVITELESERFEIISRRDTLRRQVEAVEAGYSVHLADIEATLRLYEAGINSAVELKNS